MGVKREQEFQVLYRYDDAEDWREATSAVFPSLGAAEMYVSGHKKHVVGSLNRSQRARKQPEIQAQYQLQKRTVSAWEDV